ncbi:hypothetical protein [Burkholderia sp. Ac-20365]|uniref:hypothetical protein n=1 Tax=Burkholderia sp. Ac-20365 TaxID=2703897 RepID=UPI00197B96A1|nr:hypothetical protein [Burkholderia sp. Ac-20365]MBN3761091.1 hypothetical protein [Burkholderia sp. Ac-20365]
MSANYLYTISSMTEGEVFTLFVYGYSQQDFVTYCIFPYDPIWFPGLPGGPRAIASMAEGDVQIHDDDKSIGHNVIVTAKTPSPHITSVDVYELKQTLGA